MTALALTTIPDTAAVAVQITGAAAGPVVITRTDANGANPVRLRQDQEPIEGVLTAVDYEAALVGSLRYDVVDAADATTTASTTLAGLVTGPRITGVQVPQFAHAPRFVSGYDASRQGGSAVLRVIGRSDPVVLLAPARTREGTLDLFCTDHEDAVAASNVLSEARMLMLRQSDHPGLDMYFVPADVTVTPLETTRDGWVWQTSCSYVEVRNPSLPLLGGAGWTFNEVAAYADFASVRVSFPDFANLLLGIEGYGWVVA